MRKALLIAALLLPAAPVAAQDWLKPLQDLANDLVPPRTAPRQTAPRPPTPPVPPSVPTPVTERPAGAEAEPPLPRPRPEEADKSAPVETPAAPAPSTPPASQSTAVEPVEAPAPGRIYQTACPALLSGAVIGDMLPPIAEGICGERSPLSITGLRVNGHDIGFSSPVTTNCQMAGALADWVGEVDAYARAALDSPVATVTTGTSMMCRARNGGDETAMSEHGFANALDVVGFTLADGKTIAVETDWMPATAPEGRLLHQAHGAACGRFTTVLGPDANAEHKDHLHVDLGCHGQACTAQICE